MKSLHHLARAAAVAVAPMRTLMIVLLLASVRPRPGRRQPRHRARPVHFTSPPGPGSPRTLA